MPDTEIVSGIQATLDRAVATNEARDAAAGEELLEELIPSISIDESVLEAVEERFDIVANNQPARARQGIFQ
ncbi:MAG: hypothetical protein WD180_12625 [Pseudohongiellaceae bacterium]